MQKHHDVFGAKRAIDVPPEVFVTPEEIQEKEDLMPGCEHGWFPSNADDGSQLHYRKWMPDSKKPKAIVVFTHGIQAHSGQAYCKTDGSKLNLPLLCERFVKEQGYALYAHDMYGHGFSEGKRWLIPKSWENNKKDCLEFVRIVCSQNDPSTPLFLMGESYGSNISLHVARHFQDFPSEAPANFRGTIVLAPAIQGDLPPYPVYFVLRYLLAPLWPSWRPFFMPNPISADRIWRDPEVLAMRTTPRNRECQLGGSGIPFRLGTALNLVLAMERVRTHVLPGYTTPFCIFHGTDDYGVPIAGSELMWEAATTPPDQRAFHKVENAYHDLLSDPEREFVVKEACAWIAKQMD